MRLGLRSQNIILKNLMLNLKNNENEQYSMKFQKKKNRRLKKISKNVLNSEYGLCRPNLSIFRLKHSLQ